MKTDIKVLEMAIKQLSINLNDLLTDCVDENNKPKMPRYKSIMKARGCLPKQYSMSLIK